MSVVSTRALRSLLWLAAACLHGNALARPDSGEDLPAAPECRIAEVNPVTGFAICVEPFGAPVAQPGEAELPPCPESNAHEQDWSYRPDCRPADASE